MLGREGGLPFVPVAVWVIDWNQRQFLFELLGTDFLPYLRPY